MGKGANKKGHRYWLSTKPPSRKKKYAARRAKRAQNKMADELERVEMCSTLHQDASTVNNLHTVNFPTTQSATGNSEVAEPTAAAEYQQPGPCGISQKIFSDPVGKIKTEWLDDGIGADLPDKTLDMPEGHKEFSDGLTSKERSPDSSIELVPEPTKRELESPRTRHIVDFAHIFAELQRKFANHNPVCHCTLDTVQLVSTVRIGLETRFVFKCSRCAKEEHIKSEPENSSLLSINESVVAGAASIGLGYLQAEEMFHAISIPFMSQSAYKQYHDKIASTLEKPVKEEMIAVDDEEEMLQYSVVI